MCSQGSLFGINRCARVTVSVSTLPCWPPARGKLFKGTRCHLGNVWDLSNAQGGALLSPARRSLSSSTCPCSPSPLLTPLLPSLPPCLSLSLSPSFLHSWPLLSFIFLQKCCENSQTHRSREQSGGGQGLGGKGVSEAGRGFRSYSSASARDLAHSAAG